MTNTTLPSKRGRGRPKGSKDSYTRVRSIGKLPKPPVIYTVMPIINELVEMAELNGYHKRLGRTNKDTQLAVDRNITRLLATIKVVIDEH